MESDAVKRLLDLLILSYKYHTMANSGLCCFPTGDIDCEFRELKGYNYVCDEKDYKIKALCNICVNLGYDFSETPTYNKLLDIITWDVIDDIRDDIEEEMRESFKKDDWTLC